MASIFTPNINLEEPARGDAVGIWDVPVNSNTTVLDLAIGGIGSVVVNNSPIVLAPAQFQARQLTIGSTLTGNVPLVFPSSFSKNYVIRNASTGSSAFVVILTSTVAGAVQIACPPGDTFSCFIVSGNWQFQDLGRVGTYWDYAGSSVPLWVDTCTIPPFLNCDGGNFNTSLYPALAAILGSNVLPDTRGRFRAALNQTTGRITSGASTGGVDGNTRFASGGAQLTTLSSQQMPPVKVTDPGHVHNYSGPVLAVGAGPSGTVVGLTTATNTSPAVTGITVGSSNPTVVPLLPPTYIGGITMIRAG